MAGVAMGEARDVIARALRRAVHDAQGPRLQDEVEGRPGGARVDPPDELPTRPRLARPMPQARGAAAVPADLAARARVADGAQGARDDDGRPRRRAVRAAGELDARPCSRASPAVYTEGRDDDADDDEEAGGRLPALAEGDGPTSATSRPTQHFTEPPPRFTEATLIKALEEHGIGRPSTYAATISTIVDRGYVRVEERRLRPGAGRRASSPTCSSSISATTSTSSSPRAWRRSSTRSPAASARGCRCSRRSTRRCATASPRSARSCSASDFTTEATDEVCSRGPPDGHPARAQRPVPGLLDVSRSTRRSRPLPGDEPPPQEGTGEVCPEVRRGDARRQARPVRAVRRLLPLPRLRLHQAGRPAAARAAAVRGHVPQEQRRPPRPASRAADRERLLGVLELPEVRLHDELRAARRRCTTPTTARSLARARRRSASSAARRATARPTTSCPGERYRGRSARIPRRWRGRPAAAPVAGRGGAGRGTARPRRAPRRDGTTAIDASRAADGVTGRSAAARRDAERGRRAIPATDPPLERFLRSLAARDASPAHDPRLSHGGRAPISTGWPTGAWTGDVRPGTELRAYLARLGSGASRSTVAQRLAAIRSFHRWAAREGLATGDPWGAIATPRLPRRLPRVLEVDAGRPAAGGRSTRISRPPTRRTRRGPHWRPPSRCGTGRSSRRPMPRACASASSPPPTSGRSTCGAARSG